MSWALSFSTFPPFSSFPPFFTSSDDLERGDSNPRSIPDSLRWVVNKSTANHNHTELYNMPAFAYQDGLYLGLAWVARFGAIDTAGGGKGNNEGTIHVELARQL